MRAPAIVWAITIGIVVLVVSAWVGERLQPTPVQLPKLGEPLDPHAPPPPPPPTRYGTLTIGMTANAVIASPWGQPNAVHKTITSGHIREQWVYDRGYLYLDDGRLTAIQINER